MTYAVSTWSPTVTSPALLAAISGAIPNIVFVVDATTGAVEHVSDRFVEYAGRSVEEARGDGWRSIVHPDDLSRSMLEVRGPIERGEPFRTEVRLLDRHGAYRWHDVRAAPLERAGMLDRWFGACTDIDDLRRRERDKATVVEVLGALSSSLVPDEIVARFVEAMTVELADFCAVDLHEVGHARPRRAGVALGSTFGPVPRALSQAPTCSERDAIARAVSVPGLEQLRGALAPFSPRALFVIPLSIGGQPSGHVWLASLGRARVLDERDRGTAEDLVRRLGTALSNGRAFDDATRAARLSNELIGVVSHDLRTPLSTLLGWTRLLRDDSSDPARLRHGLTVIERSAVTQSRILDELLDVSRGMSGTLRLDPRHVSIADIAREAAEAFRPLAHEKRIAMSLALEDEAAAAVDPQRIRQVIDILLANAATLTPSGGSVELAIRTARHAAAGAAHVEIEVSDSGVGIEPAVLPFVFDRFQRLAGSAPAGTTGLGAGLAIVRAIGELHGGKVEAKSDGLGAGSTFTLRLPVRATAALPVEATVAEANDVSLQNSQLIGVRVLVVDDELDARELSSTILSFHGARVATASSAEEAMRVLGTSTVDILLSDIGMPNEDGVSFVRRARAAFPRISAIALSAYARVEDEERALAAGFARYLTKPIDPAHLVETVLEVARALEPDSEVRTRL